MMTTATHSEHYNANEAVLFLAFELSENTGKLGFTIGHGQTPPERTIAARDPKRLLEEVAQAKIALWSVPNCAGGQLLRSGARRFLAASFFPGPREHQLCGGFLFY